MGRSEPLEVRPGVVIPAAEISVDYARAGGPGGQNVNKVESKVVLRFAPARSRAFDDAQRERIATRLASRLTTQGEIVIHASRFRDQERNLVDARERLAAALAKALAEPRKRRTTQPTRGSRRRRLESKRRRGEVKRGRSGGFE